MQVLSKRANVRFVHLSEVSQALTVGIIRLQACRPKSSMQSFETGSVESVCAVWLCVVQGRLHISQTVDFFKLTHYRIPRWK